MARWQCNLRPSRQARTLSLLLHSAVMLALLLAPWPDSAALPRAILMLLVLIECLRGQQRLLRCRGDFILREGRVLIWQQRQWRMTSRPWLSRLAMCLSLQETSGCRQRLWLFADGMENSEWRLLRQQLLNEKELRDE
ncbi:protein YgfX [Erwinia sorbitola]|uniref:Toxin CptA n=1 Tax=Erwinia sorbitola TaxID=2681984 RepID=A0A6I6ECP9_9GAMM|nr:protein YgfX [Erwinia sorbitola]QGU86408.1 hypothetical protein GN242_03830 [Erwinia sorbitola]